MRLAVTGREVLRDDRLALQHRPVLPTEYRLAHYLEHRQTLLHVHAQGDGRTRKGLSIYMY